MPILEPNHANASTARPSASLVARATPWALGTALVLIACLGYYSYSMRAALEARIVELGQQNAEVTDQMRQQIEQENASLTMKLSAATERLDATTQDLEDTRRLADTLQRAQEGTARTTSANATAVQAVQKNLSGLGGKMTEVDTKITGVASDVKAVAANLATARTEIGDVSRDLSARTTKISDQVAKNATDLATLSRRGERDFAEFDIRKGSSPESWTVGDVRIELKKTDVRRSKYDVVIHADDRQFEKKDRTMNEPVQFLVGSDKVRYELVVTSVDRDRIRGYVSMPKDGALATERLASGA